MQLVDGAKLLSIKIRPIYLISKIVAELIGAGNRFEGKFKQQIKARYSAS